MSCTSQHFDEWSSGFAGTTEVVALPTRVSTRVRPLDGLPDRTAASIGRTISAVVVAAFVVAVALFAWRPVEGRDYVLVLSSTAVLLVAWLGWATLGVGLLRRSVLVAFAAIGVVWGAFRAAGIDAGAEIVRTYQSLFAALDRGTQSLLLRLHRAPGGKRCRAVRGVQLPARGDLAVPAGRAAERGRWCWAPDWYVARAQRRRVRRPRHGHPTVAGLAHPRLLPLPRPVGAADERRHHHGRGRGNRRRASGGAPGANERGTAR